MNQIETRISRLVKLVRSEGAYCCGLEGVSDMVEEPTTVRVTMRCLYHDSYSFEVQYGGPGANILEKDDNILMRQIASGIVKHISMTDNKSR